MDTYGMCVIVHMMLHNSYMAIEKKASLDGGYVYQPKSHYKRYVLFVPFATIYLSVIFRFFLFK